jgi:hypothetical protein
MKYQIKMYVGGNVFYEEVIATNLVDAKRVARNPNTKILGFTVLL